MFFGTAWEEMAPRIFDILGSTPTHPERGERIEFRRPNSLQPVGGLGVLTRYVAAGSAGAGASAVAMRNEPAAPLKGKVLAGTTLVIGGQPYKTTAEVVAVGSAIGPIPIAPVLAAAVVDGAMVDIAAEMSAIFEHCQIRRVKRQDVAKDLEATPLAIASIPTKGAPMTPAVEMLAVLEDGLVVKVQDVSAAPKGFWVVTLGAR